MRDLILITQRPLTDELVHGILAKTFTAFDVLDSSPDHLLMKSKKNGIEIYFTPDDTLSDPQNMMGEETINSVPCHFQYLTNVSYTGASIAKTLVKSLQEEIGEFWIDDDDFEWLGSSNDFLTSNHQEEKEKAIIAHNNALR